MPSTLFSTYNQGENRVTSTILAVLERLSFSLVERILQILCEESERALLTFANQPQGTKQSRPDGLIKASFAYWIETKRVLNAVDKLQILGHLKALDNDQGIENSRLLVLTPDPKPPAQLSEMSDSRVAWASFDHLVAAVQEIVEPTQEWLLSDRRLATEYEKGLLHELVRFLVSEGLVGGAADRVVVVAAGGAALSDFLKYSAYICQPGRTFQPASHFAFYSKGTIDERVPVILRQVDSVLLSSEAIQDLQNLTVQLRKDLHVLVDRLKKAEDSRLDSEHKIIFLSGPEAPETFKLGHPITNDLGFPFVQGQRYVTFSRLRTSPKTTSELLGQTGMKA